MSCRPLSDSEILIEPGFAKRGFTEAQLKSEVDHVTLGVDHVEDGPPSLCPPPDGIGARNLARGREIRVRPSPRINLQGHLQSTTNLRPFSTRCPVRLRVLFCGDDRAISRIGFIDSQ